jgi:hypothetical protein
MFGPVRALSVAAVRHRLRVETRKKGYTKEQATRLVGTLSTSTITDRLKAFWAKYGTTILAILKVVLELLPLLLALEPPHNLPPTSQAEIDAIELEEAEEESRDPDPELKQWQSAPDHEC